MSEQPTPSAADQAQAEHLRIRALIAAIRSSLAAAPTMADARQAKRWLGGLEPAIAGLRDAVATHFQAEECSGLFEQFERQYPRASDRLEGFRREHGSIVAELDALLSGVVRCAAQGGSDATEIVAQARHALDELARHEQQETEILQRLSTEDIGTCEG